MGRILKEQIGKRHEFRSLEEEAMLNVYRTASYLGGPEGALFKHYGLSSASYNLLRILRGHCQAGEEQGVRASGIGCEMVVRMPDVTRLVDRLVEMKLVTRGDDARDKRVKYVRITKKGLGVLDELDEMVDQMVHVHLGHLTQAQLKELSKLLELVRNEGGRGCESNQEGSA